LHYCFQNNEAKREKGESRDRGVRGEGEEREKRRQSTKKLIQKHSYSRQLIALLFPKQAPQERGVRGARGGGEEGEEGEERGEGEERERRGRREGKSTKNCKTEAQ
jgi:hypothetical protein